MQRIYFFLILFLMATVLCIAQIPTISSFSPNSGPVGTTVTITGTNFSSTPSNNIVYFGGAKATVNTASATSLTVTVPIGATFMPITVTANDLTAYSDRPFIVTFSSSNTITTSSFSSKINFDVGGPAISAALVDLDEDGQLDVVESDHSNNKISVLRNISTINSISFATKVDFLIGAGTAEIIKYADFDGDGKQDIAIAHFNPGKISIFRNTSSVESISLAASIDSACYAKPTAIAVGDIDGDGKPDIVANNADAAGRLTLYRNTSSVGNISFAPRYDGNDVMMDSYRSDEIQLADLDGDGKRDIIVTRGAGGNKISILRNLSTPGSFSFGSVIHFSTDADPYGIAVGDLDGDGKSDIAVAAISAGKVNLFRNTSTPGFISFATRIDLVAGYRPNGIVAADLDGDEKLDLVVGNDSSNVSGYISALKNSSTIGSFSFSSKISFVSGIRPQLPESGDLDGDGKPDIVVGNFGESTISVFRNVISTIATPVIIVPGTMGSGLFHDVDGDNHLAADERIWARIGANTTPLLFDNDGAATHNDIRVAPIRGDNQLSINGELQYDVVPFFKPGPLKHYHPLVHRFERGGFTLDHFGSTYVNGDNLFIFPYDWRKSVDTLGNELAAFVDQVIQWTKSTNVDIVAHSMGGLITKRMVALTDNSKIRKVVFLAVPHQGAPQMVNVVSTGDLGNILMNWFLKPASVKSLSRNFPPSYELWPSRFYTYSGKWFAYEDFVRITPINKYDQIIDWVKGHPDGKGTIPPINSLLIDNAEPTKTNLTSINFSGIEILNVYCGSLLTPSQVVYDWWLGYIPPIYGTLGDGTVPLTSAQTVGIVGGNLAQLQVSHVKHSDFGSNGDVADTVFNFINSPSHISQQVHSLAQDTTDFIQSNLIQLNFSGVASAHVFKQMGLHTGTLSDTTFEEGIVGSSFQAFAPYSLGGSIIIVLPKDSGYTVTFTPASDTQQVQYSIYGVSHGELLQSSFFDSIQITMKEAALCTVSVNPQQTALWIDTNSDGKGDSTVPPSSAGTQFVDIPVASRWNLVSLPCFSSDSVVSSVFLGSTSSAYGYSASGYYPEPILHRGRGYWLKFPSADTVSLAGGRVLNDTIDIVQGWNLIGSIGAPISVSSITSNSPSMVLSNFYGYSNGYYPTDTIYPGKGYWVKASQDGQIGLSSSASLSSRNRIKTNITSVTPPPPPSEEMIMAKFTPTIFSLEQNYPNPFNPVTTFKYALPEQSQVRLEIFNVLGQVVKTLVDDLRPAGSYEIKWDASNNASGIYFYRISAGNFKDVKKLVLMK
jgi:hypothetical protein